MKFWIIHAQENPALPRSQPSRREWRSNTLCECLGDRGHEVVRWRSSFSHQAKEQLTKGSSRQMAENYALQFIASPDYRRHVGPARIRNHRALGREFTRLAKADPATPDLIHVCNVPIELCAAAVAYGQARGIPVVIDVRDLWPDVYLDFMPKTLRGAASFYFDHFSWRLARAFQGATAITGLTQSYLDWGLAKAKRSQTPADAIFAMCYQKLDTQPDATTVTDLRAKIGLAPDDLVASYIGNIGYQSDFETVITAARTLAKTQPRFKVVIAGSGPRADALRQMAADLPNVILPGWLEGHEVHTLMHLSAIGLIAYKPVPNFLRNIPNKFSEYLAGGLAIACGLEGEMGRLVRDSKCGFTYAPGDAAGFSSQVDTLMQDPDALALLGRNARQLHHTHFDGAQIYPAFASHLEHLATSQK